MLRRLIRRLTGPLGRRLGLALLVAAAWVVWWYWPALPRTAWARPRSEALYCYLSPDDRTVATAPRKLKAAAGGTTNLGNAGSVSLIDLATGRERLRLGNVGFVVEDLR